MDFDGKDKKKQLIELITRKDRSPLVRDLEYGDIRSHQLDFVDVPVRSKLEYDENGMLLFNDFDELDEYLEHEFIPNNIAIKRNGVPNKEEDYFSIQLNKITKLRLSEREMEHVFEYLKSKDIHIGGESSTVEADNYDYIRTYKSSTLPKKDSQLDIEKAIEEYQRTGDIKIKEKIVINHLRLVAWVAYKYSIKTGIDIHELESYGYEGLMRAVDNFDSNLGFLFSTYAVPSIRYYILNGIQREHGIIHSDYYKFLAYKNIMEEEIGAKIEDDLMVMDAVIELMVETGDISEKKGDLFRREYAVKKPISLETVDDIIDVDAEEFIFEAERSELKDRIFEVLKTLTPREEEILKLRFGLEDNKPRTLAEIGEIYGLSRDRIRQIEMQAMRKLRHPSRAKKLKGFDSDVGIIYPMEEEKGKKI